MTRPATGDMAGDGPHDGPDDWPDDWPDDTPDGWPDDWPDGPAGSRTAPLADTFVVARNPEADSTLPYLIRLPLGDGLVLKAREPWPRTARVYCHRAGSWPEGLEIIEEVPVRSCVRRGVAVDLVLDRGRDNRSQLVFTTLKGGREGIFWQTRKVAKSARPGTRIPGRRASKVEDLEILVDTRERYAYKFAAKQATTRKHPLPAGDYGVESGGEIVAVVERKTLDNLVAGMVDGSISFQLAELSTVDLAAVVVEDRYSRLFALTHVSPGWVADLLASLQVRYPGVPIVFCDSRKLAEEWTFRFLGAARVHCEETPADPHQPADPALRD